MHFSDIFKQSFLRSFATDTSTFQMFFLLCVAALLGLYIFLIYRTLTKKSFYNLNFNLSLWVLTVITAAIIITISSNIILSLGMVGALSIVRYRTAIKDPMDLVFLFWSISTGIICGAKLLTIALALCVVITVGVFLLTKLPLQRALKIMTISAKGTSCEAEINSTLAAQCKLHKVKSRTYSAEQLNLVIEYSCPDESQLTKAIAQIADVQSITTLSHDGEVTF